MDKQERECWSADNEDFRFDSLGELLDSECDIRPGRMVYVGRAVPVQASELVGVRDVIDAIESRAYGIAGEYAGDYPDVSPGARAELGELLRAWVEKHCPPTLFHVRDVRPYVVTQDDMQDGEVEQTANGDGHG